MRTHFLKSWPWFFQAMKDGRKLHDMRHTDRDYAVGDKGVLKEFDPRDGHYTGRELEMVITYMTSRDTPCALSSNGLAQDHVILSLKPYAPAV